MEKVIVIGCPGSGKSTFSKKLNIITNLPLYHLDMIYWNKDKTTVSKEEFLSELTNVLSKAKWIVDGNYLSSMELRLKECDTVFFLDYETKVCLEGIKERRGKVRNDIPWIESDSPDEEFTEFVKNFNIKSRPEVLKLLGKYNKKNIIIFKSREECENYINSFNA